jgi:hypothetical protein
MSSRTLFLSKLIGLYCIVVAVALATHKEATVETVTALLHGGDSGLILVLGATTLALGLAMILAHNIWSGSAAAVVVTVVGWITLVKGLLFLFLPTGLEAAFFLGTLHYAQLFYVYMSISLAIGIYLTYAGFTSKPQS